MRQVVVKKTSAGRKPRLTKRDERISEACLLQAQELTEAAETLLKIGKHNLAFHLAVLAIEEIGKRVLYLINASSIASEEPEFVSESAYEDHVGKLFWVVFFTAVFHINVGSQQIEAMRGLARHLDDRRKAAVYVNPHLKPFRSPKNIIKVAAAENAVALARVEVDAGRARSSTSLIAEHFDSLKWLLQHSSRPEMRTFLYSDESMKKLREFKDIDEWINWHKDREAERRREFVESVREDRARDPSSRKRQEVRWRMQIRIAGVNPPVRSSALKAWNERVVWFTLTAGDKSRKDLHASLTMNDSVPVEHVYLAGREFCERAILALNVGTLGCFWWEEPSNKKRYFEKLTDSARSRVIGLDEIHPESVYNHMPAINGELMARAAIPAVVLPWPNDSRYIGLQRYLEGMQFYSTINVFRRHEYYAFRSFYDAYWAILRDFAEIPDERTRDNYIAGLPDNLRNSEPILKLFEIGEALQSDRPPADLANLADVEWMKRLSDIQLLGWSMRKFEKMIEARKKRKKQ